MKRLLIATGIFPPDIGWPASSVPKIAKRMLQDGNAPIIITYSHDAFVAQYDTLWFQVVRITRSWFFPWHYIKYFWAVCKRWKQTDVIFLQDYFSAGIPTVLANICLRKKLITKVVGIFSREQAQNLWQTKDLLDAYVVSKQKRRLELIKRFEIRLLHQSDLIITPSMYMYDLLSRFGVRPQHIQVIYNSFDPIQYTIIDTNQRKAALGITKQKVYVSVGRLVEWKNFEQLIRAFQQQTNAILYIIGDGPLKSKLQACIEQTGQTKTIILTWSLSKDQVYQYYQLADAFVLISSYEGMSHVLLEAMAMRLFIVSSDIAPNVETLINYPYKRIVSLTGTIDLSLPEEEKPQETDLSAFAFEHLYQQLIDTLCLSS